MISLMQRTRNILVVGFSLIGIIGIIDYITGYEIAFSAFYILPIALMTWQLGQRTGLYATLVSTLIWFGADIASGHIYSHISIPFWNLSIRLVSFAIIMWLVSSLRDSFRREWEMSRTDYLTGAVNARRFYEIVDLERAHFQDHGQPITLIYIDIDNFKQINDAFGHPRGDEVLQLIVRSIRSEMRANDTIARLGGDEFVLLLPETDQESASVLLSILLKSLQHEMSRSGQAVTLSIGVLTCKTLPDTTDELIRLADNLMYAAKFEGKNGVRYLLYEG